jgi:hypothetical protein
MFYSILALLIFEPYSSSKHSGVLSYFNRYFIKSGIVSKDIGRAVNKAFDIRQRGDYREQISLNSTQVEPYVDFRAVGLIKSPQFLVKNIESYNFMGCPREPLMFPNNFLYS